MKKRALCTYLLLLKYSNFNLVVLNEELSQKIDSCKNFDLEELYFKK